MFRFVNGFFDFGKRHFFMKAKNKLETIIIFQNWAETLRWGNPGSPAQRFRAHPVNQAQSKFANCHNFRNQGNFEFSSSFMQVKIGKFLSINKLAMTVQELFPRLHFRQSPQDSAEYPENRSYGHSDQ
jgi:hypothetical protein